MTRRLFAASFLFCNWKWQGQTPTPTHTLTLVQNNTHNNALCAPIVSNRKRIWSGHGAVAVAAPDVSVLPGDLSKSMRQHMVDFNFLTYLYMSPRTHRQATHQPLTRHKPLEYPNTHTRSLTSSPRMSSIPMTALPLRPPQIRLAYFLWKLNFQVIINISPINAIWVEFFLLRVLPTYSSTYSTWPIPVLAFPGKSNRQQRPLPSRSYYFTLTSQTFLKSNKRRHFFQPLIHLS